MTLSTLTAAYTAAGGGMTGDDLARLAPMAWGYLLGETMGKVQTMDTAEGDMLPCFSALLEWLRGQEAGAWLQSQSVGDWKQEYRDPAGGRSQAQQAGDIVRRYLTGSPLLYRGWPQ